MATQCRFALVHGYGDEACRMSVCGLGVGVCMCVCVCVFFFFFFFFFFVNITKHPLTASGCIHIPLPYMGHVILLIVCYIVQYHKRYRKGHGYPLLSYKNVDVYR